jgi:hypothetical protein
MSATVSSVSVNCLLGQRNYSLSSITIYMCSGAHSPKLCPLHRVWALHKFFGGLLAGVFVMEEGWRGGGGCPLRWCVVFNVTRGSKLNRPIFRTGGGVGPSRRCSGRRDWLPGRRGVLGGRHALLRVDAIQPPSTMTSSLWADPTKEIPEFMDWRGIMADSRCRMSSRVRITVGSCDCLLCTYYCVPHPSDCQIRTAIDSSKAVPQGCKRPRRNLRRIHPDSQHFLNEGRTTKILRNEDHVAATRAKTDSTIAKQKSKRTNECIQGRIRSNNPTTMHTHLPPPFSSPPPAYPGACN